MATLNEITYRIWEKLRPNLSDDDDIDIRLIQEEVHKQRALAIRNELNKNRSVDPNIIQDLGCVELELADRADCCEVELNCTILRTVLEIPNTIELHNDLLLWVSPIDKLAWPFSFVETLERARWSGNGRFNKQSIFAFLHNKRIYIISKDDTHAMLEFINIRGVFENPQEASRFTNCSGSACYSNDSSYPLNSWMSAYVEGAVFNELIPKLKHPVDNSNDAKSNPKPSN
jgi:hypothetical protein